MKRHLFYLLSTFALLSACSTDPGKTSEVKETKDSIPAKEKFETGKVIERMTNLSDPSQTYALYLPSYYKPEQPLPVMYFFDAHAMGKLPVEMYSGLAETYGFILVGSNNSKNGTNWNEIQSIAGKLFSDSQERISINTSRVYLCGFSGGARVANALCISNGGIAGVICCGASGPAANTKDPRSNYTFLGICGNKDFNYVEMRKYDMVDLAGKNVKHAFVEFDGKHEWPAAEAMDLGFLWTMVTDMRAKRIPVSDSVIINRMEPMALRVSELKKQGKTYEAFNMLKRQINFFDGLTDLSSAMNLYKSYKTDPVIDRAMKKEENTWKKEEELQAFYQEAFQSKSLEWWKQDIASMNKKIKSSADEGEKLMYARIMDYLSLIAYMQTNGAIQQNSLPAAKIYSDIYLLVDPSNSEAHYLAASLAAAEGNEKKTFSELEESIRLGFTDAARLQSDPGFSKINTKEEFLDIVKKANAPPAQ
jgi:dienelactone hydrolase